MFRILLVDSDLSTCTSISRTLTALGYGVDVAYDADGAQRLSRQRNYVIGLFGQHLSDMDGAQLFAEIHPRQQGMTGILLATTANLYTVATAIGVGMSRVLSKPVDYRDLLSLINVRLESPKAGDDVSQTEEEPAVYNEETIAELSTTAIEQDLSDQALIQIIRSVDYPFAGKDRLEYFDRDTLERVVCLIRRWCRNRLQLAAW